jgi:hypothetical protein
MNLPPSKPEADEEPRPGEAVVMVMELTEPEVVMVMELTEPDHRPGKEEASDATMAVAEAYMAMAATQVDFLGQCGGFYLERHAANRRRHCRSGHQPEPERPRDGSEQCRFPHNRLLRLPVRNAGSRLGAHLCLDSWHLCALQP